MPGGVEGWQAQSCQPDPISWRLHAKNCNTATTTSRTPSTLFSAVLIGLETQIPRQRGHRPTEVDSTWPAARTESMHRGHGPAVRLLGVNLISRSRGRIDVRTRPNSPSSNHVPPHASQWSTLTRANVLALRSATQSGHFICRPYQRRCSVTRRREC